MDDFYYIRTMYYFSEVKCFLSSIFLILTAVPAYVPSHMKKEFLKDDGVLYLEFDITQREKVEALAKEYGFKNHSFLKDPYGHECVIKLSK